MYPDKIADTSMEKLLDVLFNSDVMIYVADAENLNSTDKVYFCASVFSVPFRSVFLSTYNGIRTAFAE